MLILTYKAAEIFLVPTSDCYYGVSYVEFWGKKMNLIHFGIGMYITKCGKSVAL